MFALFLPLLSVIPAGLLAVVLRVWRFRDGARGLQRPIKDKLLRAPGESVRKKIQCLDEQVLDWLSLFFFVVPVAVIASLSRLQTPPHLPVTVWAPLAVLALGFYSWVFWRVLRLQNERRNWSLGLSGELAVGQELNRLLADGCQVFHDFPLAGNWNIDHVVVSPTGVYAIETKTRRKGKSSPTQKAHEIIYDGQVLQFPGYYDKKMIAQAQRQARSLSLMLSTALDEPIPVTPILVLPGWFIHRKTNRGVTVLNHHPRELRSAILSERHLGLTPELMARVAGQIDSKCRDVEF